jgi:hypothetical protein
MVNDNPAKSMVILNENGLSTPMKRWRASVCQSDSRQERHKNTLSMKKASLNRRHRKTRRDKDMLH